MNRKFYGDYIVGMESKWQQFCTAFGYDWAEIKTSSGNHMPGKISGVRIAPNQSQGENVYLIEFWDTCERRLDYASKICNLYTLKQYMASQLGVASIYHIVNENGELLFNADQTIARPFDLYDLMYSTMNEPADSYLPTEADVLAWINGNHSVYNIPRLQVLAGLVAVFYDNSQQV